MQVAKASNRQENRVTHNESNKMEIEPTLWFYQSVKHWFDLIFEDWEVMDFLANSFSKLKQLFLGILRHKLQVTRQKRQLRQANGERLWQLWEALEEAW